MSRRLLGLCVALLFAAVHSAAFGQAAVTPKPVDGIACDPMEGATMHIHASLRIVVNGAMLTIPNDVGRPAKGACFYWVHTHDTSGIVHVESPVVRAFTLGQFFDVWGMPLGARRVASVAVPVGGVPVAYLNGKRWAGALRDIPLWERADIEVIVGEPETPLPAFTEWGKL